MDHEAPSLISRPVLRYHGGKWRIAPWLIAQMPPHHVYVEPFCGSASVLMRKRPTVGEVINDLDGEVVNVFQVLRDPEQAERLKALCELTPFARDEFLRSYEHSPDPIERARRTIFRSFAGHGSSSRRQNNTGFRAAAFRQRKGEPATWSTWPTNVRAYVRRLRSVVVENRPALEVIAQQDTPRTLFYLDPPYVVSARSSIRGPGDLGRAYAHEMTDDHHRELAEVLHGIQGMALISGYPTGLYDELYGDWSRREREAYADQGKARTEVVWANPAAAAARQQNLFE